MHGEWLSSKHNIKLFQKAERKLKMWTSILQCLIHVLWYVLRLFSSACAWTPQCSMYCGFSFHEVCSSPRNQAWRASLKSLFSQFIDVDIHAKSGFLPRGQKRLLYVSYMSTPSKLIQLHLHFCPWARTSGEERGEGGQHVCGLQIWQCCLFFGGHILSSCSSYFFFFLPFFVRERKREEVWSWAHHRLECLTRVGAVF